MRRLHHPSYGKQAALYVYLKRNHHFLFWLRGKLLSGGIRGRDLLQALPRR